MMSSVRCRHERFGSALLVGKGDLPDLAFMLRHHVLAVLHFLDGQLELLLRLDHRSASLA